jgi:hypothetical protein
MVAGSAVRDLGNGEHVTLVDVAVQSPHADDFLFAG